MMDLLETMRVEADGTIPLLERHLSRLASSAGALGFACPVESLRAAVVEKAANERDVMFRVLLTRGGTWEIQEKPLIPLDISSIRLAGRAVESADPMLRHKTTERALYEGIADALLVNERGEVTETGIANIAVLREGWWVTPALGCGLLPGTRRGLLLERGEIVEGVVLARDLIPGEIIRFFNARGVFEARFENHA